MRWLSTGLTREQVVAKSPMALCLEGYELVLFALPGGLVVAFEDRCPHKDAPLSSFGRLEEGELVCVLHGARFALTDGTPCEGPAKEALVPLETRERRGLLEVACRIPKRR